MMKQYQEIKAEYQDCLLFFRMGDFYELFLEDAIIGAKVLDITLTGKNVGKEKRIPMAGVPFHAVDSYLAKLVKAGYKVAICEQVSEPTKYGIVDREVIRIVTPGTVMDEKALEKKENNYIMSLVRSEKALGIAIADISTGQFQTTQFDTEHHEHIILNELARLAPAECILHSDHYNDPKLLKILKTQKDLNIFPFHDWEHYANKAEHVLKRHFKVTNLASFNIDDKKHAIEASAALLGYLKHTQKDQIEHFTTIQTYTRDEHVSLDRSTIINLELFSTLREQEKKGSLIAVLDKTVTSMGGRMMREWIRKPLTDKQTITLRHSSVEELLHENTLRNTLREDLKQLGDIERILSRLAVGIGNARDMVALKNSLQLVIETQNIAKNLTSPLLQQICTDISPEIKKITSLIDTNIVDEPPFDTKEGKMIKPDVNLTLDKLRNQVGGNKEWIANMELQERARTGISSLKVKFNKVFGFYIEISKANLHLAPDNYMRKQTLVNGERFITPELKEKEELILSAEEKICELEYDMFVEILQQILSYTPTIQAAAKAIATLDCLLGFAHTAEKENYCKPNIIQTGEIKIKNGRHPVVENVLEDTQFVPNDTYLDNENNQLLLITGPNMAGKSVYIRQVAVIVLMNQIGSFVPAEKAELSIVDRIFVRSGASDAITEGLSTFMVEMVETAQILNHATDKSLIIMDEIGRGTSTYDGISIAWAVAEYLVTQKNRAAKTLFATHYHELQDLENHYPKKIKNFHMAIEDHKGEPIFLHILQPGGASHSFGVAVAKLAGVPKEVVEKANELLHELEKRNLDEEKDFHKDTKGRNSTLIKELKRININDINPLEALNKLAELKKLLS